MTSKVKLCNKVIAEFIKNEEEKHEKA